MSRYIDADALKQTIFAHWYTCEEIDETIDAMPTVDVVEVVHCKDCIFNHWYTTPNGEKYHICNMNKLSFSEHADFFCKYGERREDAEKTD